MFALLLVISSALLATPIPSVRACNACNFLLTWGSLGSGNGQFNAPYGVALDSSGNVYVADGNNDRVQKFTNTGTYITQWGHTGSQNGNFSSPFGIAVDSSGNVYVVDQGNNRVQKFASTGAFVTKWGKTGSQNGNFSSPLGIAVDSSANVYVTDTGNNRVQKFSNTGTFITKWGTGPGTGDGEFDQPIGVAVDSSGNVYVADGNNDRVQKFTNTGTFITKWGTGPSSANGQFNLPAGIAVDSSGNVYVVDVGNTRVQKFTNTGGFLTKWNAGSNPQFVAVDSSGNVYVTNFDFNRVDLYGDSTAASIALVAGWNLISLPLVPVNTAIAKVLNDLIVAKNLTIVWSFQAGVWKSFTPPSTGTLTTMVDGLGYWIFVTKPSRIIVIGYVITPASAPPSYALPVGWNLIGFKPQPNPAATENVAFYLQSITTKYDNNAVWTYNNAASTWTRATCDYAPGGIGTCAQNLTPGQGLWVYMKTAATLSP